MTSTTATAQVRSLQIARRVATIGFAVGIACMVALFVYGIVISSAPLMVIASSTGGALGASITATFVTLNKKLEAAQR